MDNIPSCHGHALTAMQVVSIAAMATPCQCRRHMRMMDLKRSIPIWKSANELIACRYWHLLLCALGDQRNLKGKTMNATYATVLIVSALIGQEHDYVAEVYRDQATCSHVLGLFSEVWTEHEMMARCIKTNIITSTSLPVPRPDNLMEAYND